MRFVFEIVVLVAFAIAHLALAANFQLSDVVSSTIFGSQGLSAKGVSKARGPSVPSLVLVLAVNKDRIIVPRITYEGSVGGEGCSFLDKLFATGGCSTQRISGTAANVPSNVPGKPFPDGTYARFLLYTVPVGSTLLRMSVPRSGICGTTNAGNCDSLASSFSLTGWMGAPAHPGCVRMLQSYRDKWRHCSKKFLFIKRCKTRCDWKGCTPTEFVLRVYSSPEDFTLVQMTGDQVEPCESYKTSQFFEI